MDEIKGRGAPLGGAFLMGPGTALSSSRAWLRAGMGQMENALMIL